MATRDILGEVGVWDHFVFVNSVANIRISKRCETLQRLDFWILSLCVKVAFSGHVTVTHHIFLAKRVNFVYFIIDRILGFGLRRIVGLDRLVLLQCHIIFW